MFFAMQKTEHDWQYRSEPTKKASRSIEGGSAWPRGKMLGGSHGINAMIYLRGHPQDFDNWEKLGNPTWGYSDVLEYFRKSESNENSSFVGKYHGDSGPMSVGHYDENDPFRGIFIDAGKEFGYEFQADLNGEKFMGYGNAQGTLQKGHRMTTAKAFLAPAKDRPNLHVIKYAQVTRINFDKNNKVTDIEFIYKKDKKMNVRVNKETILSAGAIGSPQLLMLSGIGPKKHLEKLGIPIVRDLPVGKNLQDHVIVPVFFSFHKSTAAVEGNDILNDIFQYAVNRTGPLAGVGAISLVGLISTTGDKDLPDIELQTFSYKRQSILFPGALHSIGYKKSIVDGLLKENEKTDVVMVFVELCRPESTGTIKLRSKDFMDKPKIQANYFDDEHDIKTMLRGVKFQANYVKTNSFKQHEGELIKVPLKECERFDYLNDEYWKCYIAEMSTTVYHPVGTARMGPTNDKHSVVDSQLRVIGMKGLRVIDASIMPKMVSANVNAATIMIAEKGSDFIRTEWNDSTRKEEL